MNRIKDIISIVGPLVMGVLIFALIVLGFYAAYQNDQKRAERVNTTPPRLEFIQEIRTHRNNLNEVYKDTVTGKCYIFFERGPHGFSVVEFPCDSFNK